MATKGILIFNWEGKPIISMDLAYPFKHKPREINQTKSTMNQYKIGDTVWTRKRGECTVLTIAKQGRKKDRPYWIRPIGSFMVYNPKAENLCQSESECKKAQFLKGKRTVTIDFSAFVEIKPYQIQPKFKVGDSVYLRGGKWTVRGRYWSGTEYRYNVSRPLTTDSDNLLAGITESDLRIWKETALTHCLQYGSDNWYKSNWKVSSFKSIKFIGTINNQDTFLIEEHGGGLALFRGIKGDDI